MNSINFENAVNTEFKFLEYSYGLRCVSTSPVMVRYQNNNVFVVIRYDVNRSYELMVEIGQMQALFNGLERPFSLSEILSFNRVNEANIHSAFQASTPESVANCLTMMANQLSKYGSDFINNDVTAFKRLSEQRDKECNDYELQTKLRYIRNDAQTAWKNNDYKQIIALFEPIKDVLRDSEIKKLNYAYKHIGK